MTDYIIVGAGSAGCVLANRLTENPKTTVLLLEAGGSDSQAEIHTPAMFGALQHTAVDWDYFTEPQPHLHNRSDHWPRGKILGGSSSINAMMYMRGHRCDYDHWSELGNTGWSYDEVLPYFKKSENQARGESEYHGVGGLMHVADLSAPHPVCQLVVKAGQDIGLAANDDFNGVRQDGIGFTQVTQRNGQRESGATAFLKPVMQRPNLQVITHAHVTHLPIQGKRITGVAYIQNGELKEATADREVLLCGGAINSPQILMLSGIGPAPHLHTMGIPVIADLPGVGFNLQDHLRVSIAAVFHDERVPVAPTSNVAEVTGFIRTRRDLPAPDLQLLGGCYLRDSPSENVCFLGAILLRPESSGSIELAGRNPLLPPRIQPNYLASDADLQTLVEGFKLMRNIFQAKVLNSYRKSELMPGDWLQSDDAIRAYIRETATTTYHPVGTCKMGNDDMAVVNERLQVRHMEGLRVVDASIMPTIIGGNTHAPVTMIAEKAADLIRAEL